MLVIWAQSIHYNFWQKSMHYVLGRREGLNVYFMNFRFKIFSIVRPDFFYFLVLGSADPIFSKTGIKIKLLSLNFIFFIAADRNFPPHSEIKYRTTAVDKKNRFQISRTFRPLPTYEY